MKLSVEGATRGPPSLFVVLENGYLFQWNRETPKGNQTVSVAEGN